jgi:hypothetical protein
MTISERDVRPPAEASGPTRGALEHSRWIVHATLIGTFVASAAFLVLDRGSIFLHVLLGLSFAGLVLVHLMQRRRTVSRLARALARPSVWLRAPGRMAASDLVLALLTINLVVSGTVDGLRGQKTSLPLHDLGLPVHFVPWHTLSALALTLYLGVHIARRRRRLRRSHIH